MARASAPRIITAPPKTGRALLIVDDEEDILQSLQSLVGARLNSVNVLAAKSGLEALEILKTTDVELMLVDYRMPGLNGLEFLAEARKLRPDVPAIMMTAYPDPQFAAKAVREYGVGLFIAKPFDPAYLIEVLAAILD